MSMASSEPNFVGNANTSDPYGLNTILLALDPAADSYKWFKVLTGGAKTLERGGNDQNVYFTPDGSKLLVHFMYDDHISYMYLQPETGAKIAAITNSRDKPV